VTDPASERLRCLPMLRGSARSFWLALLAFPRSLGAEPVALDLRPFQVSPDPEATLALEPTKTPGHLEWNLGLWGSYAYRSIELDDQVRGTLAVPLEHQISADFVANLGLADRLALGVVVPAILYQTGADVSDRLPESEPLARTALGDLAAVAKATLVPSGELGGFGLAAVGRVALPTGDSTSFASEAAARGELRLLGELRLVVVELRGSAGARIRGAKQEFAGSEFGHELPWAGGIVLRPQIFGVDEAGRWRFSLESHGAIALTPSFGSGPESPAFLGVSARYTAGPVAFTVGGETALSDAVGAPLARAVLGIGFAPRFPDVDEDGVVDDEDECAELAEDRDGFQDKDGCPDFDDDEDGVPDESDKCPGKDEDTDEHQDDDGCPDPDNDHDGVNDAADKCPKDPGPAGAAGGEPGCPFKDRDVDGIPDPVDQCPAQAEDRDAFEDTDGCPDEDDDRDGIPEGDDACPRQAGPERADPALNGCPSPDLDGDTYFGDPDRCPEQAEDFDGVADDDGCADTDGAAGKPLATLLEKDGSTRLVLAAPIAFQGVAFAAKSATTVRAIASLLAQNPGTVILVGVKPAAGGRDAEQLALSRSFSIVEALRKLSLRDDAAETIAWSAVKKVPGVAQGAVGFLVLTPKEAAATPAAPANPAVPPEKGR
jgi:OOP family OmpA-OmpF porin